MTREEAIKYGIEWLKDEYLDAKDRVFITIALEALEQESNIEELQKRSYLEGFHESLKLAFRARMNESNESEDKE